jgi:hypothetical protein
VDLPTLGKPTMPHLRLMEKSPYKSRPQSRDRALNRRDQGARPEQISVSQSAECFVQNRAKCAFCVLVLSWGVWLRLYLWIQPCEL